MTRGNNNIEHVQAHTITAALRRNALRNVRLQRARDVDRLPVIQTVQRTDGTLNTRRLRTASPLMTKRPSSRPGATGRRWLFLLLLGALTVVAAALLLAATAGRVHAQDCDKSSPDYWERIERIDPDGVEHWLCSCGDRWTVTPPQPTATSEPASTATPIATLIATATPEPTPALAQLSPTATAEVATLTPTPAVVATATPGSTEPEPQWVDIVVTPTTTAEPVVSTGAIESYAEALPSRQTIGEQPAIYTNTVSVEPTPEPTEVVRLPHGGQRVVVPQPGYTEVFTLTAQGRVVGHDTYNTIAVVVPTTGGQPSLLDQFIWAIEDGSDWALAMLAALVMLVVFGAAAVVRGASQVQRRNR